VSHDAQYAKRDIPAPLFALAYCDGFSWINILLGNALAGTYHAINYPASLLQGINMNFPKSKISSQCLLNAASSRKYNPKGFNIVAK